ncbi:DUF6714 family protein [uncultured Tenacibaculum sp.]|uniref:DUF6714 family protein n=1 Tax=uncultured Tenacibaculum sp. TaxID=174713 RepID=UPI002632E43B|nr:DUF6714 family protein [uncultured Tenacibaculum sp.]
MIKKEELIRNINEAFKNIKLEEGIGLWEAQGHDDRLTAKECRKLRAKDERNDWTKISLIDLYACNSSITFFDAKGMLFHMPKYLLVSLDVYKEEEKRLIKEGMIEEFYKPDITDHLIAITKHLSDENDNQNKKFYEEYFSLFNHKQLMCLVKFIEYRMNEVRDYYKSDKAKEFGLLSNAVLYDKYFIQLYEASICLKQKLKINN